MKLRASLRVRVILAILVVALLPQLLVFVWSQIDRPVQRRLWSAVLDTAQAAAGHLDDPAALEALAKRRKVRLRVVSIRPGEQTLDADHDDPDGAADRIEAFFLPTSERGSLREIDAARGPIADREETRAAVEGAPLVRCELEDVLYCEAVARLRAPSGDLRIVYVDQSSHRAVSAVNGLRSQLVRAGLILWPFAAILAWLTGSRIVRPIEVLRRQAMLRAGRALRLEPIEKDEVGELAGALNAAFDEIDAERRQHEEFVENLVHELKSPAASVRACAEALETAQGGDPARDQRLGKALGESATKLEITLGRFLSLSRAATGFPREERERTNLAELAEEAVASFRGNARFGDAVFERTGDGDVPVLGIAHRLDAMLRELVENAASFTPPGGRVRVDVVRVADDAVIRVTDDGPGIPPEEIARIFERYYTTRGQARGTGLGLSLVRAIAAAHGGTASATSPPGGGAELCIRLPAFTPDSRTFHPESHEVHSGESPCCHGDRAPHRN